MKPQGVVKGQPTQLFVLDYGFFRVHSGPRDIGIVGFLIRTDKAENILVDTGFPQKYVEDRAGASAEDKLGEFGEILDLSEANMPASQLAHAGTTLGDISLMIQTHTHIDHVGHMDACPQAPILIARAERALARPLYWGDVQPMEWPDRDYILVDEDVEIGPGVEVLLTPGHAPGQLAIRLELPQTGTVILASDAISRPAEINERFAGSWDEALAIHHGARLMDLAKETSAKVIYGHSPQQWPFLKKAPEFFD